MRGRTDAVSAPVAAPLLVRGLLLWAEYRVRRPPPGKVSRVGFVSRSRLQPPRAASTHFWDRMRELGYVEGQNLVVESGGRRTATIASPLTAEVLQQKVDVLVTVATAALSRPKSSSAIRIVGVGMGDRCARDW